ncbi:glycosyltransferase, partial [Escherichia coli]|nr:glycosyltransferase [Escherichia coli]
MNIYKKAIVISGCWPGKGKGYEIACNATLNFYSKYYDEIIYFGPRDEFKDSEYTNSFTNVTFIDSKFDRTSIAFRFFRSLFSSYPAICVRFFKARKQLLNTISSLGVSQFDVIYEDIPTTYFMKSIKRKFPQTRHIVRSHNVVYKGFLGMKNQGNILLRYAWSFELTKILKQEKVSFECSDLFIAISKDDILEYKKIGIDVKYSLGVFIPENENSHLRVNDNNLIHIGTADLRKASALKLFIDTSWPRIHIEHPNIKLFIAGKDTEKFHQPNIGIYGLGKIKNESDLFKKGSIFINPQLNGSGIKIKSLVALNYSKCLVSTKTGVEGIDLINQSEGIICNDCSEMTDEIISLLYNEKKIRQIAENGNKKYKSNFTFDAFMKNAEFV